ncbi:hypothetical protein [Paenibacillus sp. WC2504]|uniref:hypothetical protein n=1 Tax=Paenibacillus sp. WC2504 TaxID=3461403 RepID=UPI0040455CE0
MATYKEIQAFIKNDYGYAAKSCWIAHMKDECGLEPGVSPNRLSPISRKYPCPKEKQEHIKAAFKHFEMI